MNYQHPPARAVVSSRHDVLKDSLSISAKPSQSFGAAITPTANDLVIVCDRTGVIRYCNSHWRQALDGQLPDEGNSFTKSLTPAAENAAHWALKRLLSEQIEQVQFDCQFNSATPSDRVFEARFELDHHSDGAEFLFGVLRDVSEERARLTELEHSFHRSKELLDVMPMHLWITDQNHRLIQLNERAAELFGIDAGTLAASCFELEIAAMTGTEDSLCSEARGMIACIPDSQGADRWFQLDRLHYLELDLTVGGWIYFAQDITAQHLAEEQLSNRNAEMAVVAQQLPVIIWTLDINRVITSVFGSGFRELGIDFPGLSGKCIDAAEIEEVPEFMSHPLTGMAYAGQTGSVELKFHGRNLFLSFQPLVSEDGEIRGCVGLAHDRTEIRQAQQRALEADRLLSESTEFNERFVATMSQELRSPLNSVLGASEMLLVEMLGVLNDEQQEAAHQIRTSGKHMLEFINGASDMLGLQRFEPRLTPESLELAPILESCLSGEIMHLARDKDQKIYVELDPEVEMIFADEDRFRQMLFNILSNAVGAAPEKGEILLEIEGLQDCAQVRFTVSESGHPNDPGQSLEMVKLDWSLGGGLNGHGLSLALAMTIAEALGGELLTQTKDPNHV
ncbi:MAG: PAS domain-containing sensor histidine kinase, partial [Verrucomicrobiota bacterium]